MTAPLTCPRCGNDESFYVFSPQWLQWPSLIPAPVATRPSHPEDTAECQGEDGADGLGVCRYRGPISDFIRKAAGEEVAVQDYSEEHGGDPPKPIDANTLTSAEVEPAEVEPDADSAE
jgi:hypothetical protein